MINKYVFFLIWLFIVQVSHGQTVDDCLKSIEANNPRLKAARKQQENKTVQAHTGIYPKPFSVNYGYFPDNNTVVDQKQTLNATQSFHMPGVYKKMRNLAGDQENLASLEYRKIRKEVLSRARHVMIRMVYLGKHYEQLEKRLRYARRQFEGIRKKVEAGGATLIDQNKARLHLLRVQRAVNQNVIERDRLKEQLMMFNGQQPLDLKLNDYPPFPDLTLDSLMARKTRQLPSLRMARKEMQVADRQLDLQQSLNGPELKIGYGSEIVGSSSFRGMLVGASIPLWTNKNKVQAARLKNKYSQLDYESRLMEIRSETRKQYKTSASLKEDLQTWRSTLDELQSIEVLQKSLNMDQISVLDYYREVQYYYGVYDEYLALERDYYLGLAELYRFML
jgi:outer membrane protein TolC